MRSDRSHHFSLLCWKCTFRTRSIRASLTGSRSFRRHTRSSVLYALPIARDLFPEHTAIGVPSSKTHASTGLYNRSGVCFFLEVLRSHFVAPGAIVVLLSVGIPDRLLSFVSHPTLLCRHLFVWRILVFRILRPYFEDLLYSVRLKGRHASRRFTDTTSPIRTTCFGVQAAQRMFICTTPPQRVGPHAYAL